MMRLISGRISPQDLPDILTQLGLRSVMIEGGSHILSAFLHSPRRADGSPVVDNVIVTVAPMFIGEGVGVVPDVSDECPVSDLQRLTDQGEGDVMPLLETVWTETMGKDAVMVCRIKA
jgi:2,5-diamino-6-(ribosylamino)-4(3H)-pyrimidinone 5'-phosphate reductase